MIKPNYLVASLKQTALVKIAVGICNISHIKHKICSLYWNDDKNFIDLNGYRHEYSYSDVAQKLQEISELLKNAIQEIDYPEHLCEELLSTVEKMVIEIMKWIKYYGTFMSASTEDYEMCLNSFHWSPQGSINKKSTGEILVKKQKLNICDRFKLACMCCLEADIPVLWQQVPEWDKTQFYEPDLVKFWINDLFGLQSDFNRCGFVKAIGYDNEVAALYFWKKLLPQNRKEILMNTYNLISDLWQGRDINFLNFYIIGEYYADTIYFLMSQMDERQQLNFLQDDIISNKGSVSTVLCCYLVSPYQDLFIPTANRMWSFLSLDNYTLLIYKITNKIANGEKHYDYRSLLRNFWIQSPCDFKMSFLETRDNEFLLIYLLKTRHLKSQDAIIISLILSEASTEKKDKLNFQSNGKDFCCLLIKKHKWQLVEMLTKNCISSEETRNIFLKDMIMSISGGSWFKDFIAPKKWKELEQFLKWCLLTNTCLSTNGTIKFDENAYKHRLEMIAKFYSWCLLSIDGSYEWREIKYRDLTFKSIFEVIENFVSWCFSSREEFINFKHEMIYHLTCVYDTEMYVVKIVWADKLVVCENFITWCLESKKEIDIYKAHFLRI